MSLCPSCSQFGFLTTFPGNKTHNAVCSPGPPPAEPHSLLTVLLLAVATGILVLTVTQLSLHVWQLSRRLLAGGGDRLQGLPRRAHSQTLPDVSQRRKPSAATREALPGEVLCWAPARCVSGLPCPNPLLRGSAWHSLGQGRPQGVSSLWATAAPDSGSELAAHRTGPCGGPALSRWGPRSRTRSVSVPITSWWIGAASAGPGLAQPLLSLQALLLASTPPRTLSCGARPWGSAQQR